MHTPSVPTVSPVSIFASPPCRVCLRGLPAPTSLFEEIRFDLHVLSILPGDLANLFLSKWALYLILKMISRAKTEPGTFRHFCCYRKGFRLRRHSVHLKLKNNEPEIPFRKKETEPEIPFRTDVRVVEKVEHVDQTVGVVINIKHLFNIW